MGVRSLRRHVERRLPGCRVDVGQDPTCFQWGGMRPRVVGFERHNLVCFCEGRISEGFVARLPFKAEIRGLVLFVVSNQNSILFEGPLRVDNRLEILVLDIYETGCVLSDVTICGDDRGDLLSLEPNFVRSQYRLCVSGEGWHPCEVVARQ
jgi:hypothetical protein